MIHFHRAPARSIRRTLSLASCAALVLTIAACGKTPDDPVASNDATLSGPDAKPGIAASDGRMVLPVIAGRPAAVYFTVRNDGAQPVSIAGVHVSGAGKAEMHQSNGGTMTKVGTLPLDPGASMVFSPAGLHVMAFDLSPKLKAGGTAELTLTFADGDKLSMPLAVEAIGQDSQGSGHDGMEGMHH